MNWLEVRRIYRLAVTFAYAFDSPELAQWLADTRPPPPNPNPRTPSDEHPTHQSTQR